MPEFCPVVLNVVDDPLIVLVGDRFPFAVVKLVKTKMLPAPGSATYRVSRAVTSKAIWFGLTNPVLLPLMVATGEIFPLAEAAAA